MDPYCVTPIVVLSASVILLPSSPFPFPSSLLLLPMGNHSDSSTKWMKQQDRKHWVTIEKREREKNVVRWFAEENVSESDQDENNSIYILCKCRTNNWLGEGTILDLFSIHSLVFLPSQSVDFSLTHLPFPLPSLSLLLTMSIYLGMTAAAAGKRKKRRERLHHSSRLLCNHYQNESNLTTCRSEIADYRTPGASVYCTLQLIDSFRMDLELLQISVEVRRQRFQFDWRQWKWNR